MIDRCDEGCYNKFQGVSALTQSMKAEGICICGLNGSGKTTLGRMLAEALQLPHMDVENYYFSKNEAVPYSEPRTRDEVCRLLAEDTARFPKFVFSAVNGDFGEEINARYRCVIYLSAPQEIRMARIRERSRAQFGSRIAPGGDMYEQELAFWNFAAQRTPEKVEAWLATLSCPVLKLDGRESLQRNVETICKFLRTDSQNV